MKIMVFGSMGTTVIPDEAVHLINSLIGNEFIVGDCKGVDDSIHLILSRLGARSRTTVYCMDFARCNTFDFETKVFPSDGLVGRTAYEYKDRQMCNDCDMAIAIWDGTSRGSFANINILKAQNKPVYVYKV